MSPKGGLNAGFQIATASTGTRLTVSTLRDGSVVNIYDIAPNSVKHICKCLYFINQDCFEELSRLKKSITGPKLCIGEPQPGGDERFVIPQILSLDHHYVQDGGERGIGYAVATPPTLQSLSKAVIRSCRLDRHLKRYAIPAVLQAELGMVEEEHRYLQLDDEELPVKCPCEDRYGIFPVWKIVLCPKVLAEYDLPDIIRN